MKIRKILIFISLCFLVNCARNTMPPSMPFEKTELRNNKASNTPEIMIWYLQNNAFFYQKKIKGKYPANWFEADYTMFKLLKQHLKADINEGFKIDDPVVLTFYEDYKTKTKWYKYIIDKSNENGFLIHSENNCGAQDWAADRLSRWWYFTNKKDEFEEIEKREKILKSDKFLFIFSNEDRRIKAIRDLSLFHDPKAFEILINTMEDKTVSVFLKRTIAANALEIPQLQRFKDYLPRIEKIISEETDVLKTLKRYPNWQEYDAHERLILWLQKLTKLINGEIEKLWQKAKEQ